ncbi:MAG: hypothetical protein EOM20_14950 [Spartobacteria bacterium]|nr:hypothetical protein [Spartobacteria bacterium]
MLRKPKYEGFTKVGEELVCAGCGFVYESEELVPYKKKKSVQVFTDADRPAAVELFEEGEATTLCRFCKHYVVNPFMQWCARHRKEVEATDTCKAFEPGKKDEEEIDIFVEPQ